MNNRDQRFDMLLHRDYSIEVNEGEENFIFINMENVDRFIKALLDFRDFCEAKKAELAKVENKA